MIYEARTLLDLLLRRREEYFSDDVLNSEGRKVLGRVARILMRTRPETSRLLKRVRREPTLDNVAKLARALGVTDAGVHATVQGWSEGW